MKLGKHESRADPWLQINQTYKHRCICSWTACYVNVWPEPTLTHSSRAFLHISDTTLPSFSAEPPQHDILNPITARRLALISTSQIFSLGTASHRLRKNPALTSPREKLIFVTNQNPGNKPVWHLDNSSHNIYLNEALTADSVSNASSFLFQDT